MAASSKALEEALDELFGADPKAFVEARNRLAKALDAKKRRPDATVVRKVRRASLSVWVVNRLYRDQSKHFARLLAVGDLMRAAQKIGGAKVLSSRKEQADVLRQLHDDAIALLKKAGHPASVAVVKRIDTNLRALSGVGSFAPDAPGRLTADREDLGFEAAFSAPVVAPVKTNKKAEVAAERRRQQEAEKEEAEKLRAEEVKAKEVAAFQKKLTRLEKQRAAVVARLAKLDADILATRDRR